VGGLRTPAYLHGWYMDIRYLYWRKPFCILCALTYYGNTVFIEMRCLWKCGVYGNAVFMESGVYGSTVFYQSTPCYCCHTHTLRKNYLWHALLPHTHTHFEQFSYIVSFSFLFPHTHSHFEKFIYIVTCYSKYTIALNFQNFLHFQNFQNLYPVGMMYIHTITHTYIYI
jgi:hypothetical protein